VDTLTSYKLTLLFIFTIVVPSTLLSLFSLSAISGERDRHRARIAERCRQQADEIAGRIERELFGPQAELEEALAARIARLGSLEELRDLPRELLGSKSVFRAAALFRPSGALVVEGGAGAAGGGGAREGGSEVALLDEIFRPAEELELRLRDDRAALAAYEAIERRHGEDDRVRLEALMARARLTARLGAPLDAYDALDEVIRRYPLARDRDGNVLSLAARLEIAAIYRRLDNRAAEAFALEELVRFIGRHAPEIDPGAVAFYRREALDALRRLDPRRAEVALAAAEADRQDREAEAALAQRLVKSALLAKLRGLAAGAAAGKEPPSPVSGWLVERSLSEGRLVLYWRLAPPAGLAAFEVALDLFRARAEDALAAAAAGFDEGSFRLVDRGAALFPAGPGEEEVGRRPLRFPLDYLEIAALRGDKASQDALGQLRDRVQIWAIGLALVGLAIGAFVMTRAVRKEMKAAALKSDFVTTVTHELKTPLTSIGMFAETLLMGRVENKAEEKECLEIIARETDRLTRLIDRVLTFSKIEARKKRFDLKLCDMAALVDETVEIFKTQLRGGASKPYSLEVTAVQDLPKVLMDRAAIQEVLLNLISNAYKYGGEQKRIAITLTKRRRWVLAEVRDWGIGIPWREQRKIFRKFYRANDVLTRDVEGSGIGLTLAQSIARAHRGAITVRSRLGHGSTFTLWLPR
jgi:signal transduction histidine kinase